ncbi:MAG TPA: EamA family transporter [Rhizomicrobium sp.]|nr:EamA family transporter [Rhizomicrobium sp.]
MTHHRDLAHLSPRDMALGLLIVFFWGTNFVVVRWGLGMLPPLLMAAIRFSLTLFPAILFLKKPDVSWGTLALYGATVGTGQFGLLYIAMNGFISPGVASLVMQLQVFFTIAIAAHRTGEKPQVHHLLGLVLAVAGIGVILMHNGQDITLIGLALSLAGALCWAISNQTTREAARAAAARGTPMNPLAFVVWASLFAMPGLFAASLVLEGPTRILAAVSSSSWVIWPTLLWQSAANTLFGYTMWAWLLSRYPAATVAPMSLLVPVFGIGASALVLHEPLPLWKITACLLIMAGLAVNLLWRPRKVLISGEAS